MGLACFDRHILVLAVQSWVLTRMFQLCSDSVVVDSRLNRELSESPPMVDWLKSRRQHTVYTHRTTSLVVAEGKELGNRTILHAVLD